MEAHQMGHGPRTTQTPHNALWCYREHHNPSCIGLWPAVWEMLLYGAFCEYTTESKAKISRHLEEQILHIPSINEKQKMWTCSASTNECSFYHSHAPQNPRFLLPSRTALRTFYRALRSIVLFWHWKTFLLEGGRDRYFLATAKMTIADFGRNITTFHAAQVTERYGS